MQHDCIGFRHICLEKDDLLSGEDPVGVGCQHPDVDSDYALTVSIATPHINTALAGVRACRDWAQESRTALAAA